MTTASRIQRWVPLILIGIGFFCFYYFHWVDYFSFNALKEHHQWLLEWTRKHYFLAVLLYIAIYITLVTLSVPGAAIMTITGGFLFGIIWGTLYVIVSATTGALLIYLAVRYAFEEPFSRRAEGWVKKMRTGFQANAFNYLLFLRLIPLFPFWVVNIVPALLGVKMRTFVLATFLGIIPGSVIYVSLGEGLSDVIAKNQTLHLNIIFEPSLLLPILGLALLSLLPVFYKRFKRTRT